MKKILLAMMLLVMGATPVIGQQGKILQPAPKYASIEEDCRMFVHHERWRPHKELHTQCTVVSHTVKGAVLRYRYPGEGVPTSFGALIEDNGHGAYGDIPFLSAYQSKNNPKIGIIRVPGPREWRPHGIYVHIMYAVWNGDFEGVREVNWWPYG